MLKEAASLFNESYGVWGTDPAGSQRMPKQGELRKDSSGRVSNGQDRNSREAEQTSSTSPISPRKRRLLLRKSYNRGSPGRECVCLSVESKGQKCVLDYSTCCTRRLGGLRRRRTEQPRIFARKTIKKRHEDNPISENHNRWN